MFFVRNVLIRIVVLVLVFWAVPVAGSTASGVAIGSAAVAISPSAGVPAGWGGRSAPHVRGLAAPAPSQAQDPTVSDEARRRVVDGLLRALNDENEAVRARALEALAGMRDERAIPGLLQALSDAREGIRASALEALAQFSTPEAIGGLMIGLKDASPAVRALAARHVSRLIGARPLQNDPQDVEILTGLLLLQDAEPDVRAEAVAGLSQLRRPEAVPSLLPMLQDADTQVRVETAVALGLLADPRAIDALTAALTDAEPAVREEAARALGLIARGQPRAPASPTRAPTERPARITGVAGGADDTNGDGATAPSVVVPVPPRPPVPSDPPPSPPVPSPASRPAGASVIVPVPPQESSSLTTENPLESLREQLGQALTDASLPFTPEQERAIVLMMEERRLASESLFGDLMNFSSGPTSGQEADRLKSAIEWMRGEFATRISRYLTTEQLSVWTAFETAMDLSTVGGREERRGGGRAQGAGQTQFVRINNNTFTAENSFYRRGGGGFGGGGGRGGRGLGNFRAGGGGGRGRGGGGRGRSSGTAEVIERGGFGAWHGTSEFLFKDEALNARNAFASNKPSYQERQLSVDVGGPAISGRLTTEFSVRFNRTENVGTVRATLADDSVFALGITRPLITRSIFSRNTYQVADAHSLRVNYESLAITRENQGIGDFTLPERASAFEGRNWRVEALQFSAFSNTSIFESRFNVLTTKNETVPFTDTVRINVLDAFRGGGSQNQAENTNRTWDFSSLYTRFGEALTIKAGWAGTYRQQRAFSTNNFGGTFAFSSLDAFRAGTPLNYRVRRGDPLLETTQLELGAYIQNDLNLSSRFTLMFGVRYDGQTNFDDSNNVAPRLAFAYSIGPATVIRGGAGIFYSRLNIGQVEDQRRLDGTRQFELVIDRPSYPDPFIEGRIRTTFPSVRVTDPLLQAPSNVVGMLSVERTFARNLLVTASYDYQREDQRFRLRNLNAPVDITSPVLRSCRPEQDASTCLRPDPNRGNVVNLESTGHEIRHALRLSARQRFSIFNVTANYTLQRAFADNSGISLPMDNYDLRADWGRSSDARHSVNTTVNAQLPLGIFLSGTAIANSGRYYTITTGKDGNRDTQVNDRPPGVPRNSARGPRFLNLNFNVSKAVFLDGPGAGTRKNINVFANLTNAFNWVHLGTPSGVLTSPSFGQSTSAFSPREVEIGLRFQF